MPGDVVEIETASGMRHVQVTHTHQTYPEILRGVKFDGKDIEQTAKCSTLFRGMFPLLGALKRGSIKGRKIGVAEIPIVDRKFPIFKMPVHDRNGNIAYWWFWDGDALRYDASPVDDLENIPKREVLAVEMLLEKLMMA